MSKIVLRVNTVHNNKGGNSKFCIIFLKDKH